MNCLSCWRNCMKSVESKDKSMHSATAHRLHDQHVSVVSVFSIFHCSREENLPGKPWALFFWQSYRQLCYMLKQWTFLLAKLLPTLCYVLKQWPFPWAKLLPKLCYHAKVMNFKRLQFLQITANAVFFCCCKFCYSAQVSSTHNVHPPSQLQD